ncbi:hypothetical protein V1503_24055 [Bacillus sp. SCS-151]|uniref:hypothetical protein n=1 Tax=Nanhaiella sioensis TaxID=3115293 RepID=UPI00397A9A6F
MGIYDETNMTKNFNSSPKNKHLVKELKWEILSTLALWSTLFAFSMYISKGKRDFLSYNGLKSDPWIIYIWDSIIFASSRVGFVFLISGLLWITIKLFEYLVRLYRKKYGG